MLAARWQSGATVKRRTIDTWQVDKWADRP
jgi:hypothetical protein